MDFVTTPIVIFYKKCVKEQMIITNKRITNIIFFLFVELLSNWIYMCHIRGSYFKWSIFLSNVWYKSKIYFNSPEDGLFNRSFDSFVYCTIYHSITRFISIIIFSVHSNTGCDNMTTIYYNLFNCHIIEMWKICERMDFTVFLSSFKTWMVWCWRWGFRTFSSVYFVSWSKTLEIMGVLKIH